MASASVYTFAPAPDVDAEELEEWCREIAIELLDERDYETTYRGTDEELVDWALMNRGGRIALHRVRNIPNREIVEAVCEAHPDAIDGVIRVGAEDTYGSMNARMFDVDDAGDLEQVDRERLDDYRMSRHGFNHSGVRAVAPEL